MQTELVPVPAIAEWRSSTYSISIRYQPGTISRREIRRYGKFLEKLRSALVDRLGISLPASPVSVAVGMEQPAAEQKLDSSIYAVAPGAALDRTILGYWLQQGIGAVPPPFIVDGLRSYLILKQPLSELDLSLKHAIQEGAHFAVTDYLTGQSGLP